MDEADTVELINGERMLWEQVKRDGIDYIALYYVNEKGKQVQIWMRNWHEYNRTVLVAE